ncbi:MULTISPECIES: hypothetical protein [Flavobacterium]|uniref:YARHG domain-containing protein n=1 Tax=Flavobacterium jumunjinense TaxID=998845 RepID=A0ABV5GT52_9FLAO|nr:MULTISPECIES: hypothetical protein [Flavobacterium]
MKTIITLLIVTFLTSFSTLDEEEVYLCGTEGAKKYHLSKSCRGLSGCKHEITKKKLSEAKELGLKLCAWED